MCWSMLNHSLTRLCFRHCEGVLEIVAYSNSDLDMAQKNQRGRLFVREKRICLTKEHQKRRSSVFIKYLAKPKEIVTKNMSGN